VTKTLAFYIMPKRTRADTDAEEEVNSFFDSIFDAASAVDISLDSLSALKTRVLSNRLSKGKEQRKAATDFSMNDAIEIFGLKYEEIPLKFSKKYRWDIENEEGMEEFPITPCIGETLMYLVETYKM
jgi:hypothetical protein